MSLSPPILEPIESPIFEASSPLNLRQSPRDETRYNFGLFGEVSDSEVEVNTHTHIPIGSTPKIGIDNIPLSNIFNTEPKDSSDRYDKIISKRNFYRL